MADEPNKNIPVDPHAVPDADPAGTEAASTPVAEETGPRAAGATRAGTGGQDAAVSMQEASSQEVPSHEPSSQEVPQHAVSQHRAPQRVAPHLETSPHTAPTLGAAQHTAPASAGAQHAAPPSNTHDDDDEDEHKPRIPIWYALKRAIRGFSGNQLTTLAAALTYYAVLAVAPTLVALVSIIGVVGKDGTDVVGEVLDTVEKLGAGDAVETIKPILTQVAESPGAGIALIVGALIAIWSASSYVTAFSRASNRIYDVAEGRPIWKLRPAMYLVAFALIVIVAVAAVLLVVYPSLAASIGDLIGLSDVVVTVWNIAKWPVVLLLALIAIALLYRRTPNVRPRKFRLISWGAAVAVVVWIVASVGFGIYVANFSNYGATYGTLAGVIIFLLWVWISNLALLFGAQLDAELERGRQLRSGIIAEEDIQLRRRDTKASDKQASKERKVVAEGREIRVNLTGAGEKDSTEAGV